MYDTWGILRPDTPFAGLFADRRVPLRSVVAIIPREEGAPACYLVEGKLLDEQQLAWMGAAIYEMWKPECASVADAIAYIRDDALPLRVDWFESVGTCDYTQILALAKMGGWPAMGAEGTHDPATEAGDSSAGAP